MEPKYCLNCGAQVNSKFCGSCGAKYSKKELDVTSLFSTVFEVVTNWEQKMWITLKLLIIDPAKVSSAFILGERRKYFHPVKFVMFWAGINILLATSFKSGLANLDANGDEVIQKTYEFLGKYISFFWVLMIPFISTASYLLFRKYEPRFVHHNIITTYMVGINLIISLPGIILEGICKTTYPLTDVLFIMMPLAYCFYTFRSYFHTSFWKALLSVFLCAIFFLLGFSIVIAVVVLLFYYL